MTLPDPRVRPTITVEEAATLLACSRGTAYQAARRGELPGAIRMGRRVVVATAVLLNALGLSVAADLPPTQKGASPGAEP